MNMKLHYIKSIDGIDYYVYYPKLFAWYFSGYPEYEKPTFSHNIRMLIEYLQGGFRVIYMKVKEDIVGYLVIASGGRRLKCSDKKDIVIGPIWIRPSKRGKGYGTKGINAVLHELGEQYNSAYEYIKANNMASIRSVEKNGFILVSQGTEKGILKKVYPSAEGEDLIYKYSDRGE